MSADCPPLTDKDPEAPHRTQERGGATSPVWVPEGPCAPSGSGAAVRGARWLSTAPFPAGPAWGTACCLSLCLERAPRGLLTKACVGWRYLSRKTVSAPGAFTLRLTFASPGAGCCLELRPRSASETPHWGNLGSSLDSATGPVDDLRRAFPCWGPQLQPRQQYWGGCQFRREAGVDPKPGCPLWVPCDLSAADSAVSRPSAARGL